MPVAYRLQLTRGAMGIVEWIGHATAEFHDISDEDALRLLENATVDEYRRYLASMYGFVCPLERALASTPGIDRHVDPRKLQKHELLRRDLSTLHVSAEQIERLPRCAVPCFTCPEEALGWAYPLERSTLRHGDLFRHLASILPGEAAFASSYLKCYFGTLGAAWREFGRALEAFEHTAHRRQAMLDSARESFRRLRGWRFVRDGRRPPCRAAQLPPRVFGVADRRHDRRHDRSRART